MIENTVDPATGMATVRATMPNKDELLWPGTLVTTDMTLRSEEGVVVPSKRCKSARPAPSYSSSKTA